MRVDNCRQVDFAGADLLFQNGRYSALDGLAFNMSSPKVPVTILVRMSWIDNHGILGLVVDNQVRVVITTPLPWLPYQTQAYRGWRLLSPHLTYTYCDYTL